MVALMVAFFGAGLLLFFYSWVSVAAFNSAMIYLIVAGASAICVGLGLILIPVYQKYYAFYNKKMGWKFVSPDGGDAYEIIADALVKPTSELPSHLAMHNYLLGKGLDYKAALHTHPIELVAMSHTSKFLEKDVLTDLLWSMIPETKAFCPRGLGIVPYRLPGSQELADATIEQLDEYDVVLWEKHGVCAVGCDIMEAFDQVDVLSKSAQIYINAKCMGYEPDGMSKEQMREMTLAFDLPK